MTEAFKLAILFIFVPLIHVVTSYSPYPEPGQDVSGQYCAGRAYQQCCPGRDDSCTVPILDTICYCDIYCNRTRTDCCPDFWRLCIGIEPPAGALPATEIKNNCFHDGELHAVGTKIHPNCNNCTCVHATEKMEYNWKCTQKICLIQEDLIDSVNFGNYGWKAQNYSQFWGKTLDHGIKYRLGTYHPMKYTSDMSSIKMMVNANLPASFDAREKWPGLIHEALDQGDCGASWAFSTASVASDRLSIHSDGMINQVLSPQNILDCNNDHMQNGCDGGHLDRAWWYLRRSGITSDTCYTYKSGTTGRKGKCRASMKYYFRGAKLDCSGREQRRDFLYQMSPPYRIANDETEIMKEIMENGPVQSTMEVKEDFFMYKSGIYQYTMPTLMFQSNHRQSGYHSVRIIGWGEESGDNTPTKYWLCINSWGTTWGENGAFKIVRGQNECKIESFVLGVRSKIDGRQMSRAKEHNQLYMDQHKL